MSMVRRHTVTSRTHEVFGTAHDLADALGHDEISPGHVLLAMVRQQQGITEQILWNRVTRDVLEREIEAQLPAAGVARAGITERAWSPADEQLIDRARKESREQGKDYIGCEHVLLALLRDTSSVPAQVLARHGIAYSQTRDEFDRLEALTAELARRRAT